MPRMRFVKHEFFMDDDLATQSHTARLLFIGLWTLADREGRLEDKPLKIKAMLFPYEQIEIEDLLRQLSCGFITRYTVGEKSYIQIDNFSKHQRPHVKEPKSTYPAPAKNVQAPDGRGKNAGSLVLGSGSLVLGSGYNDRNGSPSAVDLSQERFPYGKDKGVYIVELELDRAEMYLQDPRLSKKTRAALTAHVEAKKADRIRA